MPFMPFNILGIWFRGLLSIAILAGGIYLLKRWYDESYVVEAPAPAVANEAPNRVAPPGDPRSKEEQARMESKLKAASGPRVFRFEPGWNEPTGLLAGAIALLTWATLGRWIGQGLFLLTHRPGSDTSTGPEPEPEPELEPGRGEGASRGLDTALTPVEGEANRPSKKIRREQGRRARAASVGSSRLAPTDLAASLPTEPDEDPKSDRTGEVHTINRPDGSVLRVECYGPVDAPPIVFTHGWGANSAEWFYQKKHLADRFRLILWDEPGLGLSKKPDTNDYSMENLAADLVAVIGLAKGRPVVLVGHSIGGMITLDLCKAFPEELKARVAGIVLAHTSYTNPVRTTQGAWFYTAIEKPVLIPMMYVTIALWPLFWAMTWMSYLNGSLRRSTHKSSFSGNETRGQLEFVTNFSPLGRPDVLARGMLGMIAYDATATLSRIKVPTLVFVGDEDTTTLPEAGAFIAKSVPKGRLVTLSPAKHMGLLEHHDRFDRNLAEFAASCQSSVIAG